MSKSTHLTPLSQHLPTSNLENSADFIASDSQRFALPFVSASTRFAGGKRGRKPSLDKYAELGSLFGPSTSGGEKSNVDSEFPKTLSASAIARTRDKFRLQDEARHLLGARSRVHSCLRARVDDSVSVLYSSKFQKAFYGGLVTCGSAYLCPVCALKIAARRQEELQNALAGSELTSIFVTYTIPHRKGQPLDKLFSDLRTAHTKSLKGRFREVLASEYGIIGRVVSVDIVYGDNGWHPHLHVLFLSALTPEQIDLAKFKDDLFTRYSRWLARLGGYDASEKAFMVKLSYDQLGVAEYLLADYSNYGISAEITQGQLKKSRKGNSLTPFGLLNKASRGCQKSADLFLEYAKAMKRKSVLRWSRGLRDALGLQQLTDEEIAKLNLEESFLLNHLTDREWDYVVANKLRADVQIAATRSQGDVVQFCAYLVSAGIRAREDF